MSGGGHGYGYGYGLRIPKKAQVISKSGLFAENEDKVEPLIKPNLDFKMDKAKVEAVEKEILEQDPMAFEYDKVFESESSSAQHRAKLNCLHSSNSPRYMPAIMEAAAIRKRELELSRVRKDRRIAKENVGNEIKEEQVFITSAYKKKLEEMKQSGLDPDTTTKCGNDQEDGDGKKGSRDMARFQRNLFNSTTTSGRNSRPGSFRERSPDRKL